MNPHRRWATAFASCSIVQVAAQSPLPFEYSKDFDLLNQQTAVQYFEEKFYEENRGSLLDDQLQEVHALRERAQGDSALALAAAQVLYMFAWFSPAGEIIRDNIIAAANLFEKSIPASMCHVARSPEDWVDFACDVRWMHAALLFSWLGRTDVDRQQGLVYLDKAKDMLHGLQRLSRKPAASSWWTSPLQINFNSFIFPGKPSRPIWETASLPMGLFLEEAHPVFKAELEAILNDPRNIYKELQRIDPSREHLANRGKWETVRIVRYGHWYDLFCTLAPETCRLIKTRPEIVDCKFMNVNYVKLNPGAHLKPHYGNGPRLSAHLSVIAPEPLKAGMSVGDEQVLWVEGKAILFDDTYPHAVSHWGDKPRYVMLVWFCHPCDQGQPHMQECPTE
mmetsp:Transcript_12189/g.27555  ORF Transcript_12189/g.27555 Transcript_12189/m.27555 type:complete len:393 (-) Transcript_12189:64-1242(-)